MTRAVPARSQYWFRDLRMVGCLVIIIGAALSTLLPGDWHMAIGWPLLYAGIKIVDSAP